MEVNLLLPECKLEFQTTTRAVGDIYATAVELLGDFMINISQDLERGFACK